ncbi:hypothetical protein ACWIGW_41270 [Nocardia brasiliensis]
MLVEHRTVARVRVDTEPFDLPFVITHGLSVSTFSQRDKRFRLTLSYAVSNAREPCAELASAFSAAQVTRGRRVDFGALEQSTTRNAVVDTNWMNSSSPLSQMLSE